MFYRNDDLKDRMRRGIDRKERLFDRNIDRKERLAQTYIVVYGLLIACGQSVSVPTFVIQLFFLFLVLIIIYYSLLSNVDYSYVLSGSHKAVITMLDVLAFVASSVFCFSLVSFLYTVGSSDFWSVFALLTFFVFCSLCVPLHVRV